MTRRGYFLLLISAVLIVAGLITRQGPLIALAFPLLAYLVAAAMHRPAGLQIRAERIMEQRIVLAGNEAAGLLHLHNAGETVELIEIGQHPPVGSEFVETEQSYLTSFSPEEIKELPFRLAGPRGEYRFPPLTLHALDSFGLFENLSLEHTPLPFSILPPPIKVRAFRIRPPHTRGFAGPIPSRQAGTGLDFLAVREYQSGDSLRTINWKRSARSDREMYTNTFEQHRIADAGIIVDARQQSDILQPEGRLFEFSVSAAGGLAEELLRQGNRVGLLVYGAAMLSAFPGVGKRQMDKINRILARADTGFSYALEKLDYLPTRFFPPRSQIIMLSPIAAGDIPVLTSLVRNGYAVLVISPNPVLFDAGGGGKSPREALALRTALAERQLSINLLRRHGVQVVDWDVNTPLESHLRILQPIRNLRI